jgi:hypothetical protein
MSLDTAARQNEEARKHLERTKERLADGRVAIERLRESIDDTNRHIESMSEWIDESGRLLEEDRRRRDVPGGDEDAPA